jgi:glycosyltransferase involved in cell wall biosynthesis
MKSIIENKPLQDSLVAKGRERLSQFSWARTTGQLLEVFKQI